MQIKIWYSKSFMYFFFQVCYLHFFADLSFQDSRFTKLYQYLISNQTKKIKRTFIETIRLLQSHFKYISHLLSKKSIYIMFFLQTTPCQNSSLKVTNQIKTPHPILWFAVRFLKTKNPNLTANFLAELNINFYHPNDSLLEF